MSNFCDFKGLLGKPSETITVNSEKSANFITQWLSVTTTEVLERINWSSVGERVAGKEIIVMLA